MSALSVFSNLREVTKNFVLSCKHFTGRAWNFNCSPVSSILWFHMNSRAEISLTFIYWRFRWSLNSLFFGLKTMNFKYKNSWFFLFLKTDISVENPRRFYEERIPTKSAQRTRAKGSSY